MQSDDANAPDWLDQQREAAPEGSPTDDEHGVEEGPPIADRLHEADEADVLDQLQDVPVDDDDEEAPG